MTEHQFAAELTKLLDRDGLTLGPDARFREHQGWDSLCVLLTISFADEAYGKQLTGKQIASAQTVSDLWKILEGSSG